MLDSALSYARAGYRVLPLRGKIPLCAHGSHDATTDEQTIRDWWAIWPTANIGMTLDGLVVVDVDPRNGGHVEHLPLPLPQTCIARTGGGGLHYLYRAAEGIKYPASLHNGVDQKSGPFSYIVVAPSVHANGSAYEWLVDPRSLTPADAPDWISRKQDFIRMQRERTEPPRKRRTRRSSGREWIEMDDDEIAPGIRCAI